MKTHLHSSGSLCICANTYSLCWTNSWNIVFVEHIKTPLWTSVSDYSILSFNCPSNMFSVTLAGTNDDRVGYRFQVHFFILAAWCANNISTGHDKGSMPSHKSKTNAIFPYGGFSANPSMFRHIHNTSLGLTCCEIEKPIIISPSGTSQDTVAESARRCMTDTLTGAGGRSDGKETEIHFLLIHQIWNDPSHMCPRCTWKVLALNSTL